MVESAGAYDIPQALAVRRFRGAKTVAFVQVYHPMDHLQ